MGELADAGAAASTDDGRPVATAGLMRRALAYNALTGRRLTLHCEEPSLTHGGHMHMGSVSVEHLRAAQARGVEASGEVTPHHLCLTDEAVRSLDPNLKMIPPLRTSNDRSALIAALIDGTIEAIATDHAPHSREEKDVPFESAPFGVTGLETAFASLYTLLVVPGLVRLETLVER